MGMDFSYAGSASYPRFDRELCAVAEVFGGIKTEHLTEREATENERLFGYWFGFLSSDNSNKPKFIFPEDVNKTLVKWFNNIYEYFTISETKIIWYLVSQHPEIKEISYQIWTELKECVEYETGWQIY